jgi:O-antigen/teichoic acid export membrane protein
MEEKFTSSISSKRLGKETFIYIPVFLVPAFINILTLSLFTRLFSPELYGEYSLVINTTIIVSSLMGQWIVLSIQRFRPEYRKSEKLSEFNFYLNKLLFQMNIVFIFLSIFLFVIIPDNYKSYYLPSIVSIVLSVYFMVLGSVYQIDLLSQKFRNLNVINAIGKLPITFLLLYVISFKPEQFIWGTILMQLFLLYPMLRHIEVWKKPPSFTDKDKHRYKHYVRTFFIYGFPLIGWYIGTTILNLTDRYMIQIFRGSHEVGIYSANFTIAVQALALVCNPFFFAIQPMVLNKVDVSRKEMELTISKYTRIYILLSIPFGIYFSIFRNEVSSFLLGEQFVVGASIIPILIAGFFFWNLGLYGQLCCQVDKRTSHMFYFVVIAAIINIILNLFFIPRFGFNGAAISTGVGFFLYSLLLYLSSFKHTKWKIPWLAMVKILLIGLLLSLPLEYLRQRWLFDMNPIIVMVIGTIYFPIYVTIMFFIKELSIRPVVTMFKRKWR